MRTKDNSAIILCGGGMIFAGPDGAALFRAIALRSALKLAKVGIRATRGLSGTRALAMCHEYTGKKYRRGAYDAAIADVTVWIENMKCALPVEVQS